jgi:hypothetical protein
MLTISTLLGYAIPFASFIIGILGYERLLKKDNEHSTKDMITLITKVDMLLNQSTTITVDVKRHEKLLTIHDVKIQNLEENLINSRRNNENE